MTRGQLSWRARSASGLTLLAIAWTPAQVGAQADPSASTHAEPEASLGVRDRGIFSDLDRELQLALPSALAPERVFAIVDRAHAQLVLYDGALPIKVYPLAGSARLAVGGETLALRPGDAAELGPLLAPERTQVFSHTVELPPGDADGDGIPDPLDVLIGAHKTALNADRYDGRYEHIAYPNGDVPRTIGVCTDVVIRALRNAGYDLQRDLHEDVLRAPRAYPMIAEANSDIDHRRVKSLLPYFIRHFDARSAQLDDPLDPLRPGDIVFMDTFPLRRGSEHIGILSNVRRDGHPLVINNWTDGSVTRAMDLLPSVPITHRFRITPRLPDKGPIAARRTQLLTIVADSFSATRGALRRYEREPGKRWRAVGAAIPVVLGYGGYGWGDGVHGRGAPSGRGGPEKREGDGRSPAGAFELGTLYGYAAAPPSGSGLAYVSATPALHCIDDPNSAAYNRITDDAHVSANGFERMRRDDGLYELALEIEHNSAPVVSNHGSCIFMHVWTNADTPVTGCTGMSRGALLGVLAWLQRNAAILVALPRSEYRALQASWGLP